MQQAALFRRERQIVVNVVLGLVCVNKRNLRDTSGFHLCNIDRVLLRVYSPVDHAEERSRLHYHAEKDRLVIMVLSFVGVNLRET